MRHSHDCCMDFSHTQVYKPARREQTMKYIWDTWVRRLDNPLWMALAFGLTLISPLLLFVPVAPLALLGLESNRHNPSWEAKLLVAANTLLFIFAPAIMVGIRSLWA